MSWECLFWTHLILIQRWVWDRLRSKNPRNQGACLSSSLGMEIVTDHYKWRASGAAFDTPLLEVCYGGDSPLGNRDPVSICIKIQAHHHRIHGGLSQSVTNFLSNLIPGGIIWVFSWWLWFIPTDKRGKAHPLCSGNNQRQKQRRDHHSFLVPIDEFFMKQLHDMLIEGNHEKLYPEKSSGIIRLNQLSVWFFNLVKFGQEEQDGKQTQFFWIFVNFCSMSWRKY